MANAIVQKKIYSEIKVEDDNKYALKIYRSKSSDSDDESNDESRNTNNHGSTDSDSESDNDNINLNNDKKKQNTSESSESCGEDKFDKLKIEDFTEFDLNAKGGFKSQDSKIKKRIKPKKTRTPTVKEQLESKFLSVNNQKAMNTYLYDSAGNSPQSNLSYSSIFEESTSSAHLSLLSPPSSPFELYTQINNNNNNNDNLNVSRNDLETLFTIDDFINPEIDLEYFEKLFKEFNDEDKLQSLVCAYEVANMSLNDIKECMTRKDKDGNLLLHITPTNQKIKHILSSKTIQLINVNLTFDGDGYFDLDSYYFTKTLIERAKREIERLSKNNQIENNNNSFFDLRNIINQNNKFDDTPVMIAIKSDRLDILELYYPYANFELRNGRLLHTCLHIACLFSSYDCFEFLMKNYYSKVENTAFINLKDKFGNSALGIAIKKFSTKKPSNSDKIIKYLINCKYTELNFVNKDSETLAHIVSRSEYCPTMIKIELLKLLKLNYSDLISKKDKFNKSVLDCWDEVPNNSQFNSREVFEWVLGHKF